MAQDLAADARPAPLRVCARGLSDVRVRQSVPALVGCALVLAMLQVLFTWAISIHASGQGYVGLCQWDSLLYAHIAEHGYRSTIPPVGSDWDRANVAFFPGYPLLGRAVSRLLGVPVPIGLLLAAQLSAWAFWTYLLLFFRRWGVRPWLAGAGVLAVIVHPAAFYLVVGYSESLFLMGLLGFLYWCGRDRALPWVISALHGLVMTATRIAGLPLAFYPVFGALAFGRPDRSAGPAERVKSAAWRLLPCAAGSLGGLAFFAFCQWRFGRWDLYMWSQQVGWGIEPDYLALVQVKNYVFYATLLYHGLLWPDDLSRLSVLMMLAMFLGFLAIEYRLFRKGAGRGPQQRMAFYLCGMGILFLHAAGASSVNMRSMIRYTFGTHVLLVLAAVELAAAHLPDGFRIPRRLAWWLLLAAGLCGAIQAILVRRFTDGLWVA